MNDREIMENLLLTTKGVCDLYMHGTIESATQNVHTAFDSALRESLCMQDQTSQTMSQKGWSADGEASPAAGRSKPCSGAEGFSCGGISSSGGRESTSKG